MVGIVVRKAESGLGISLNIQFKDQDEATMLLLRDVITDGRGYGESISVDFEAGYDGEDGGCPFDCVGRVEGPDLLRILVKLGAIVWLQEAILKPEHEAEH